MKPWQLYVLEQYSLYILDHKEHSIPAFIFLFLLLFFFSFRLFSPEKLCSSHFFACHVKTSLSDKASWF